MPNFHTAWQDSVTEYTEAAMQSPLDDLDEALSVIKNLVIACDGVIAYNKTTGVLSWSGTLRFLFTDADGNAVQNTAAAGDVTLTDGKFAYVDLSATNGAPVVVYAATLTPGSASNFVAYNRVMLAYRNATGDDLFSAHLHLPLNDPDKLVQTLTCADSVTVDWSKGSMAEITLDRASTTFAFSGAYNGQRCLLVVKQYSGPGAITLGSEVRGGTGTTLPVSLSLTDGKKDYIGFIYNGTDSKYDYVSMDKGH